MPAVCGKVYNASGALRLGKKQAMKKRFAPTPPGACNNEHGSLENEKTLLPGGSNLGSRSEATPLCSMDRQTPLHDLAKIPVSLLRPDWMIDIHKYGALE